MPWRVELLDFLPVDILSLPVVPLLMVPVSEPVLMVPVPVELPLVVPVVVPVLGVWVGLVVVVVVLGIGVVEPEVVPLPLLPGVV